MHKDANHHLSVFLYLHYYTVNKGRRRKKRRSSEEGKDVWREERRKMGRKAERKKKVAENHSGRISEKL